MIAPVSSSSKKRPAEDGFRNPWLERTNGDVQQAARLIFFYHENNNWLVAPVVLKEQLVPQVLHLIEQSKGDSATFEIVNQIAVSMLKKAIFSSRDLCTTAHVYNTFWRTNNPLFQDVKQATAIKFLSHVEADPISHAHSYHLDSGLFCVNDVPFENGDLFSLILSWLQSKHQWVYDAILYTNSLGALTHRLKSINHRDKQEYPQALEELELYLKEYPDDQEYLRLKGKLLLRLSNPQAIPFADALVKRFPSPKNYEFIANMYWRLGKFDSALDSFAKSRHNANDIESYLASAYIKFQAKNWNESRKLCDKIHQLMRGQPHLPSLCLRAQIHIINKRSQNLVDVIAKIEKSPENRHQSLLYRGYYHLLRQEYDKAQVFFEKGLKSQIDSRFYLGLARVNLALHDFEQVSSNLYWATHFSEMYALSIVQTENFTQANFAWFERLHILQEAEEIKKEMNLSISFSYQNRIETDEQLKQLQEEVIESFKT